MAEPEVGIKIDRLIRWAHDIGNACMMLEKHKDENAVAEAKAILRKTMMDIRDHAVGEEKVDG